MHLQEELGPLTEDKQYIFDMEESALSLTPELRWKEHGSNS
jgi:hypothetical protein